MQGYPIFSRYLGSIGALEYKGAQDLKGTLFLGALVVESWKLSRAKTQNGMSNYSLKELFQFSKSSESSEPSELIDRPVEEPSRLPMDTNDTPQVNDPSTNEVLTNQVESSEPSELIDRPVEEPSRLPMDTNDIPQVNDPSTNQVLTNPVSFNSQDAIELVQSPLGEYSWWPSPASGIGNGTPGDFPLDFDEDAIESAQTSLGHYASEDLGLPSTTASIDNETPGDFTLDFGKDGHPSLPQPPSAVWAGETEYNPPGIAIIARNEMIHD
jgi:hypothetical protein